MQRTWQLALVVRTVSEIVGVSRMNWKNAIRKQDKFTEATIEEFDLQPDAFSPRRQASIDKLRTAHFDLLDLINNLEEYTSPQDLQENERMLKDITTKEIELLTRALKDTSDLLELRVK